ncbi:MAG: hypothetical protein KIG36_02715 [Eubacteriales bacterium]|nr:hypothetical protein [Eubacteriales bacterium]
MALIDKWKRVGRDFKDLGDDKVENIGKNTGRIARDFGKSMVASLKHVVRKASSWADEEEEEPNASPNAEETSAPTEKEA